MYNRQCISKYRSAENWHCRGYLPHFDPAHATQFVTFRLADSLPTEKLRELQGRLKPHMQTELRKGIELLLDQGHGSCVLRDPRAARIVIDCLQHFDGARYDLLSWCVMPNHVHVLIRLREGWTLAKVVQNWKTISSKLIGVLLGRSGRLWQPEYFDRVMRDEEHLINTLTYIEHNPVAARLCSRPEDFHYGSAFKGAAQIMPG